MNEILGWQELFEYGLYLRGIVITFYAILLFRVSSPRIYGNHSPLDFIIYIIVGAILGEAIVNNIPLLPSMIVSAIIVLLHHLLAYLCFKSHSLGKYIKGDKVCIIKNGKYLENELSSCRITHNDILQALRIQHGITHIKEIKEATLERDGQISFIFKKE